MRLVLNSLVGCFLLSPLALFAQNAPEAPPAETAVTNVAPEWSESRAKAFAASYSLELGPSGTASGIPAEPDPSPDPQGNCNGCAPVSNGYVFPSRAKMVRYWAGSVFGPRAYIGGVIRASWGTWASNSPEEWDNDFPGWSNRFGASVADNAMNQSALVLLSGAMHQDPMYYRCVCSGFWPRMGHVIKMTFAGRNRSGDTVFSPAKVISPFVGPMVTRHTIYPDRFNSGDAAAGGASYLLGSVAWNAVREFIWNLGQH